MVEHISSDTRRQRRIAGQGALTVIQAGAVDGHALPGGQCAGLVTDRATRLEQQRPITLHQALIVIERPNPKHQVLAEHLRAAVIQFAIDLQVQALHRCESTGLVNQCARAYLQGLGG